MNKLLMAFPLILTSACASVLPSRQPPPSLPPPAPIAIVPPAECTLPGEPQPQFSPRPLPARAPETADAVTKLKAELARAVDYGDQAVSYADTLRVWAANERDRDVRCATWVAGLNR